MVFVAITGNDANPGTLERPFATLQRAQEEARKSAGREAITIFAREGTYTLPEPLVFTAEDSGTKAAPMTLEAYQQEQVVVRGGNGLKYLVELRGAEQAPVRFISLKGLTFRHDAGALFATGTEDCSLEDCFMDRVGGDGVRVHHYNRRLTVRGCHIAGTGANGVVFAGDREASRLPRVEDEASLSLETLDPTPGTKTPNFPEDCLVEDCLIYGSGRVEKQAAPVQIGFSRSITVRHCSLYDAPGAGVAVSGGCWGGHVVEFCDVFDTGREAAAGSGAFTAHGHDRTWRLKGLDLNDDQAWADHSEVVLLDARRPVVLRYNRWRCDYGPDIDAGEGSKNFHIYCNLCLNGGIRVREGFYRAVENNVIVNNGFQPLAWCRHSADVFLRNITWTDHYLPGGDMPDAPWGWELDYNLVHRKGAKGMRPATKLAGQSGHDEHSIIADARFADPAGGDFTVKAGSPALALGFVNIPMDRFGVRKPGLRAIARTPALPEATTDTTSKNLAQK